MSTTVTQDAAKIRGAAALALMVLMFAVLGTSSEPNHAEAAIDPTPGQYSGTFVDTATGNRGSISFTILSVSASKLSFGDFTLSFPFRSGTCPTSWTQSSPGNIAIPTLTTDSLEIYNALYAESVRIAYIFPSVTQATGHVRWTRVADGCAPVEGDWTATRATSAVPTTTATATPSATGTPSATATPAPSTGIGTITSGSVPAGGGFGLIVYGGGTVAQLVTATRCPVASMALYIARGGDFLTYVPGTSIAVVNQAFLDAFPGGAIPVNTPLIGRCV